MSAASKEFQKEAPLIPTNDDSAIDFVTSTSRIKLTQSNEFIYCPSVFTKTRFCFRKLSIREITECYDQTHDVIEACMNVKVNQRDLPFLNGDPNKIVQHILKRLNLIEQSNSPDMFEVCGYRKIRSEIVVLPTMDNGMLNAVKADDALVENSIWDIRVLSIFPHMNYTTMVAENLNVLQRLLMKRWRRNDVKSFTRYLIETYGSDWRKPILEKQINLE